MTRKQIDAAHEARMWLAQVIIPAVGVVLVATKPETRAEIADKFATAKDNLVNKFKFKK